MSDAQISDAHEYPSETHGHPWKDAFRALVITFCIVALSVGAALIGVAAVEAAALH